MNETWGLLGRGSSDPYAGFKATREYSPYGHDKARGKKARKTARKRVSESVPVVKPRQGIDMDDAARRLAERFGGHVRRLR